MVLRIHTLVPLLSLVLPTLGRAFVAQQVPSRLSARAFPRLFASEDWKIEIDMPPVGSGIKAYMKILPILSVPSEIVQVRYKVPFGLNVEPKKSLAVCTKDGPGGEKVGDVLRYTTQWTLGLPAGDGLVTTAASFAGGLSWQCSMFDVMNAKAWEQVVEALVSNVDTKTDEVVLLFERPLEGTAPEVE
ncbi:predicted protein [Phaeodactylum tricornutum CCAP 1055/1]|jgi:hypothetical protein|uniref:Uncharacterized protein n=1 Tax=Phaeodactylum tricornutum (strain CCAP 1055/1) TaxID=556484 RepID=B5Y3D3_PHATC|nr:predicted protein [Phaeodactylum tricornutum CCAP 1055/1]ACI65100.1 predicted protein [Phaeodactylum tricornutum CCAP 1055/1]|eukprot:XP_002185630.1 predicted protein [Phaeodactylum tricornutum CCAP 1055/1]